MGVHYDQETFYKLPDWEKLKLKRSKPKYRNYRMMTLDQESLRREVLYGICSHFGMVPVEDLDEDAFSTMKQFWPTKAEYFLTPKILDYLSVEEICKFGYCSYCIHYEGYFRSEKIKDNVIPFKGVCGNDNEKDIVPCTSRCSHWELGTFHVQLMYVLIEKRLNNFHNYNFDEYIKDLGDFNFWSYFFHIK